MLVKAQADPGLWPSQGSQKAGGEAVCHWLSSLILSKGTHNSDEAKTRRGTQSLRGFHCRIKLDSQKCHTDMT